MEEHRLDFHGTFRKLSFFRPSLLQSDHNNTELDMFISDILALSPEADHTKPTKSLLDWLHTYSERILSERDLWKDEADMDLARENAAKRANPRFVLRQWVLEEVIKKVEKDTGSGKKVLGKILQVGVSCLFLYCLMLSGGRWLAIHSSRGERKEICERTLNSMQRLERRGGIVGWGTRRC